MPKFEVGDAVILAKDLPEKGLNAGQIGAVVLEFTEPALAYETGSLIRTGGCSRKWRCCRNRLSFMLQLRNPHRRRA